MTHSVPLHVTRSSFSYMMPFHTRTDHCCCDDVLKHTLHFTRMLKAMGRDRPLFQLREKE